MLPTFLAAPTRIAAAGNKPKLIDEFIGKVNSATAAASVAQMRSPGGWVEPGQTPDFDEFTVVLKGSLRVEFEGGFMDVASGQAVIAHGYPRLTKDMDLWVRPAASNGARVLAALAAFGAASAGLTPEQFEDPRTLLMLGREPFRVDILTDIPVTFDEAWDNRMLVTLDGVSVPVIGKRELIRNKRAVGRLQDLADAEQLELLDD